MKGYNLISVSLDSTDIQTQLRLAFFEGPTALFTRPVNTEKRNLTLKLGSTAIFTYLKIISLQCFQFSVFSFQQ